MPTPQPIPFWTKTGEARSPVVSQARLRNWYLEPSPDGVEYPYALYPTPGLKLRAAIGDGPIRGVHEFLGSVYVVSGTRLYRMFSDNSSVDLGEIAGYGPVHMVDNGTHIAIAATKHCYAANASEVLALPEEYIVGLAYQDGYGIFAKGGTEQFFISGVDDMTTISALDFSSADVFADRLVGCISDHRELILFGETTVEGWYNSGQASFPFARAQGSFVERGCVAKGSIAKADNRVLWLGDDLRVYSMQGWQPQRVSNPQIEQMIDAERSPQSAWSFVYSQAGHTFYVLSFGQKTLVLDLDLQQWHERKSDGINRWRVGSHTRAWSKHIVGDYANGNIYELDLDTYTDNGSVIRREAVSDPIRAGGSRVIMDELHVDVDAGQGLVTGQGSDPEMMLDWSDDGGRQWSNRRTAKMGQIGEYETQVRWNRLGMFRQRALRIIVSDPVKAVVTGAYTRMRRAA